MTQHLVDYGLVLLFLLIAIESAGVPLPGETALIAAAIMTRPERGGHWSLWLVIVVASAAAITGDNVGYWLGRTGGRKLISRWGVAERYAAKA
jgi:membrane protein DedA with SNARE-associated domain